MRIQRRELLGGLLATSAWCTVGPPAAGSNARSAPRFPLALNGSTLRGHRLPLREQLRIAWETGYDGFEVWLSDLESHERNGGRPEDLAKECADHGLTIVGTIGFASWIVDDPQTRRAGLEQLRRDMDRTARLGARYLAAPPAGAHRTETPIPLDVVADRFRVVAELGREMGVTPQLEIWGSSTNLRRLEEAAYVLARTGHPNIALLADVFHIYKGGSSPHAMRMFGPSVLAVFHMNDYPENPPHETIRDADRIWPGDGVAPLRELLQTMAANGARPALSLELFNESYWKLPAAETARIGLKKMREVLRAAGLD